jgi:putative hemolysin
MFRNIMLAAFAIFVVFLAGCATPAPPGNISNNTTIPPANNTTGIPNPASQFCESHNGTLQIREGTGGQHGVCSFASGAKCEEWAYYRGECSQAEPDYCEADSDCGCGVLKSTHDCFYGQKEFVDETQQCPDFCNGIAAHLEIKCVQNQCKQVQKNRCTNYGVDACPADCAVCPPCEVCSSISCQSEEFCRSLGFGNDWYNTTVSGK